MKFMRDPVMRMQLAGCIILMIVVSIALGVFVEPSAALFPPFVCFVVLPLLAISSWVYYLVYYRLLSRRCPKCGYDLTMSRPSRCPSCGAEL